MLTAARSTTASPTVVSASCSHLFVLFVILLACSSFHSFCARPGGCRFIVDFLAVSTVRQVGISQGRLVSVLATAPSPPTPWSFPGSISRNPALTLLASHTPGSRPSLTACHTSRGHLIPGFRKPQPQHESIAACNTTALLPWKLGDCTHERGGSSCRPSFEHLLTTYMSSAFPSLHHSAQA